MLGWSMLTSERKVGKQETAWSLSKVDVDGSRNLANRLCSSKMNLCDRNSCLIHWLEGYDISLMVDYMFLSVFNVKILMILIDISF